MRWVAAPAEIFASWSKLSVPREKFLAWTAATRCWQKPETPSEHHQWHNVKLWQEDATEMRLPAPVDGVLFSLSYTVIPNPVTALEKAWKYLQPKRHVVIMDGKLAHGLLGRLSRPLVTFLSKATVLGDPDRRPWEDLKKFTPQVEMEEVNFGTYYSWAHYSVHSEEWSCWFSSPQLRRPRLVS